MKSNEEFIAGIYEKAAVYAENKEENKKTVVLSMRTLRTAAMLAVCAGLLGVGGPALHRGTQEDAPEQENAGDGVVQLANHAVDETPGISVSQFRGIPEAETELLKGKIESVDREEGIVRVTPEPAEGSTEENQIAALKWDTTEEIPASLVEGTRMMAEGITETYSGANGSRSGSIQLTLTDVSKLPGSNEETGTYKNCNNEERK